MTDSPWTTDGSNPGPGIPAELDATLDEILWSGYEPDGQSILAVRFVASRRDFLSFRAEGLHQRGPYSYARLTISHDLVPLAWGQCCIGQPDSRGKIADATWLALEPSIKFGISRQQINRYLNTFCAGLGWAWGELLAPAPSMAPASGRTYQRTNYATEAQRTAIRTMRRQIGITDNSDLPDPLTFERAADLIDNLNAELAGRTDA